MRPRAVILHSEVHKDWSGEPIRVFEEASGMAKRGYRVVFAAPPDSELIKRASDAGLCPEPLIMKKWISYPYSLLKAIVIIVRNKVDIVNTHASYDSWIFSIAARLLKRKLIRTRHMSINYGSDLATKFIYRLPDFIITSSGESDRQILIQHFQLNPEGVISIPSSPDLKKFNPDNVTVPVESFGIRPGEKVIGIVATISEVKGHIYLIKAMPEIIKKSKCIVKFLIVGGGDSSMKEDLMKKADTLGVSDRCIFTGHRDDIPEMLSLMDIFVLPSCSETTSQVLQQAMAMRLPVISCPVGGIPELLGCSNLPDFKYSRYFLTPHGILIPTKDPNAIAEAVIYLLDNPELCKEIGQRNRAHVVRKYSKDIMLDKIEEVYTRLLDG